MKLLKNSTLESSINEPWKLILMKKIKVSSFNEIMIQERKKMMNVTQVNVKNEAERVKKKRKIAKNQNE